MNNPDTQNTRQIEGGCAKSPKIFWRSILIFGCIGGALIGFTACRMLSPDHVDYAEELRFAVYENDTNRVKVLLEQHPEVVESAYDYNPHGDFIAHTPPEANTNTNRVFRNYLLEQYRPLHIATAEGHLESIRLLLAAHANPNLQDLGGMTPLHAACFHPSDYHPSAACVSLLLEAGANPNLASKGGTPLQMVAIQQSSIDVARLLLDHGADPNFYPSHIP